MVDSTALLGSMVIPGCADPYPCINFPQVAEIPFAQVVGIRGSLEFELGTPGRYDLVFEC